MTASQDKALWHTEPKVMFKGEEESKHVTQQGLSRDINIVTTVSSQSGVSRRAPLNAFCSIVTFNALKT